MPSSHSWMNDTPRSIGNAIADFIKERKSSMIVGKGTDRVPIEAGLHPAILIWQIDIGSRWSDKYKNWQSQVIWTFELPGQRIKTERGDEPRVISNWYTPVLSKKSRLLADLTSWRGKGFTEEELRNGYDTAKALGASCRLNIIHGTKGDGSIQERITAILKHDGKAMKPHNPLIEYWIKRDGKNIPDGVPDWMKKYIVESPEYKAIGAEVPQDDELPPDEPPNDFEQFANENPAEQDDCPV